MSSELTTMNAGQQVSLVDIRMDRKRFPQLKSYTLEDATMAMFRIITKMYLYTGQTIDKETIMLMSSNLVSDLLADEYNLGTPYITFEEIHRAVKKALLNPAKDKEIKYLSMVTIYGIIRDYVKGEGHNADVEAKRRQAQDDRIAIKKSIIAPMIQELSVQMAKKANINNK